MNDAATRPAEFGTGLRAKIAHGQGLDSRTPARSSRDLVVLCAGKSSKKAGADLPLPGRELPVAGPRGAFAA
ncbi:MAG TPA: hypothetical protein VNO56_09910 [Gaiellaceae bacterium]|nr:hypothetical protein [Gaiellaceae bacterium]